MPVNVGELIGYLRLDSSGFDRGISVAQQEMRTAAGTSDKLSSAVGATSERLAAAGRQANLTAQGSAKMRAQQLSLIAAQERYNNVLGQSGASLGRLASAEAAVVRANARVTASARAQAEAFGQARSSAETMPPLLTKTASGMASATRSAIGLGVAFGVFEAASKALDLVKEANTYQASMVRIRALTGTSADEINRMNGALLGLAGEVAAAPDDLALSLYHMKAIGLPAAQALEGVKVAAEGARIGNANLEETTNALTSTIASGIGKNQAFTASMQDILTIVGTGDMKLQDFNDSLSTGGLTVLANYGLSLKDVGAALAVFGDNNVRGRDGMTKLIQSVQSMAVVAPKGQAQLDMLGISANQLAKDLSTGGLDKALLDLRSHLAARGLTGDITSLRKQLADAKGGLDETAVAGSSLGQVLTQIFTKRAGTGLAILLAQSDRLQSKFNELSHPAMTFEQRWNAVTKTTSFHLAQLGHEAQAAGITLAEKATPAVGGLADLISTALPAALHTAAGALHPFVLGWHDAATVLGPVAREIGDVLAMMGPAVPLLRGVGGAALAMWLAFKGYQVARAALFAVQDGVASLAASTRNGFAGMRADFGATGAQLSTQSAVMRAEFAQIEAAALADAAATDRAAAIKAVAYADEVAASKAATDAQVRNAELVAASAGAQARASAEAAAASAAAATTASAEIDAAGSRAAIGWSAMLGPIGLVVVGVLSVASMFHKSASASKDAAEAAKAYTDALAGGSRSSLIDTITKQLADKKVPETLESMATWLGRNAVSGKEFVAAIEQGGKPLDTLRAKLEAIVKAGHGGNMAKAGSLGAATAADEAKGLLKILDDQSTGIADAVQKDLEATKAFSGVSSSIDKVSQSTKVGSDTARRYATMMGIVVDQNGVAAVSAKTLQAAVTSVSQAYGHATQTGDAYLSALNTFSQSAGTAADRAALIGATLKASNGDALNFAGQMNTASVAVAQLGKDARDAAKNATKGGESTRAWLASVVNLKKGTIDYSKAAAAPLITDLQGIQTAGMNAASAMYQHARATMSGKDAADAAYKVYVSTTRGQLIDQLEKLGANDKQAKRLADRYLGMPKQVKTLIEAQGTNPIVDILNRIGQLLANLTGQRWDVGVNVIVSEIVHATAGMKGTKNSDPRLGGSASGTNGHGLPDGVSAVGEDGAELVIKRGPHAEVLSNRQARAFLAATGMRAPGFASGTSPKKNYDFGNATYHTKGEYQSAVKAATSAIAGLLAAARNVNATADQMRTAAKDLRNAAKDQKLSAQFQKDLARGAARLDELARRRDSVRDRLGTRTAPPTAYDQLRAAQDLFRGDRQKYSDAVTGNFDVTGVAPPAATTSSRKIGAATVMTTKPASATLTASMIVAADQADVAKIAAFDRLIHRLVAEGLDPDYVAQIAGKGPTDEAMATARALAKATPKQVSALNRAESGKHGRKAIGNDLGTFLAKQYDQAGVNAAQGLVHGLLSEEKAVTAAADHIAEVLIKRFKKRLAINSPSRVGFELGGFFPHGVANGMHHKLPLVEAAADRLAGAMVPEFPRSRGAFGDRTSSGGTNVELNVYGQPGQSPSEIAHIAAGDVIFHLDR